LPGPEVCCLLRHLRVRNAGSNNSAPDQQGICSRRGRTCPDAEETGCVPPC
jgi:hypothetical protein